MTPAAKIRQYLAQGHTMHVVGANDALSARLIEQAGFDAVYVGSYSTNATFLGKPDLDLMSRTERLMIVRNIVKAVSVPVIADIEEGYGNAIGVMDTIREFEAAGVAAVHLDDERTPAKCPVMPDISRNELITVEEMCGKIRAAVASRRDPDLLLIARSDIVGTVWREEYYARGMMEEVVRRSNAYIDAGADAIMIMGFNPEELRYYAERVKGPLVGLYAPAEPIAFREFRAQKYAMAIGTIATLYMYIRCLIDGLKELKETEDWNAIQHRMVDDPEFFRVIGLNEYKCLYKDFSIP